MPFKRRSPKSICTNLAARPPWRPEVAEARGGEAWCAPPGRAWRRARRALQRALSSVLIRCCCVPTAAVALLVAVVDLCELKHNVEHHVAHHARMSRAASPPTRRRGRLAPTKPQSASGRRSEPRSRAVGDRTQGRRRPRRRRRPWRRGLPPRRPRRRARRRRRRRRARGHRRRRRRTRRRRGLAPAPRGALPPLRFVRRLARRHCPIPRSGWRP